MGSTLVSDLSAGFQELAVTVASLEPALATTHVNKGRPLIILLLVVVTLVTLAFTVFAKRIRR